MQLERLSKALGVLKNYAREKNLQDFQPSIVCEGKDLVVQRSMLGVDGSYTQQTSYHVSMVINARELPL